MGAPLKLWSSLTALLAVGWAAALPKPEVVERQTCTHGPNSRNCWSQGFDINTNYHETWPSTGQSWTYDLRITNTTCNPDGHGEKMCQLINNSFPGPTIRANWGDTVRIIVHNDLKDNGTSIHWHGIRQLNSCAQDGTNGVTECPIAPGMTKTYEFKATQYGTSWYHSHHTAQYGEGTIGTVIVNGPATANYDEDLGVLPLTDWHYDQIYSLLWRALYGGGGPPPSQNVLVNGTMIDGNGNGKYNIIKVEKGKKYRLRFINTSVDHFFQVSLDGHPFTVISADFVPVVPYQSTDLKINIGQRYDVVFTADKDIDNYWLRVNSGSAVCGRSQIYNNANVVVGAVLNYQGANSAALPASTAYPTTTTCVDESITPYVPVDVPSNNFNQQLDELDIGLGRSNDGRNIVNWLINGSSMDVDWEHPTLEYIRAGNTSYAGAMNVVEMNQAHTWYYWIIQNANTPPLPHPIHLHGHDFHVLGTGTGTFPRTLDVLNFVNPVRRDVATLPASGWMVIAFPTNNPGAWLMHCHIAWHASQGLSMQFVERREDIISTIGSLNEFDQGCKDWREWWNSPARIYIDEDSGLFAPLPPLISAPGSGI